MRATGVATCLLVAALRPSVSTPALLLAAAVLATSAGRSMFLGHRYRAHVDARSEARFRRLVQGVGDLVVIVDDDARVRYASPAARRILGYEPEELDGVHGRQLVHADDHGAFRRALVTLALDAPGATTGLRCRIRRQDGTWCDTEAVATNMRDDPVVDGLVLTLRDVTDRTRLEAELRRTAFSDPLTGVANRALFVDRVEHALSRRDGTTGTAVLFLDLDDFKTVNDGLGHAAGDELLHAVAERLQEVLRPSDTVARMGGDEFAVLLEALRSDAVAIDVAERVLKAVRRPVHLGGRELRAAASVGITFAHRDSTVAALLRDADAAMYVAKGRGKGRAVVFEPSMHEDAVARLRLVGDLERAVEQDALTVAFQPIHELASGAVVGFEALARWTSPEHGTVPPVRFIPLAEETGLIERLGRQVLAKACAQASAWRRAGLGGDALRMTVNVSPRQLTAEFPARVAHLLTEHRLSGEALVLELTESAFVDDDVHDVLVRLQELGVRLAIDDFGTGYSSLGVLQRLPLDIVKIDRSFVSALGADAGTALAQVVVRLADVLGVRAVAEGVETEEQRSALLALGCTIGQGYHFAPPMGAREATALLQARVDEEIDDVVGAVLVGLGVDA